MTVDKSRKFLTLVRLGFAARGLTYILLGVLALGASGKPVEGATGVFEYLREVPLGTPLLWLVAIGLLAYALFKLLAGIANLENHDSDAMGAAQRVGELASGAVHLFLSYAAYRFASGAQASASGGGEQALAQPVMDLELGAVLIGTAGLGMLAAAAMQAKHAITGLTKSLALDGRPYEIACGQIDIGNADTPLTGRMKKGVPQANGTIAAEPTIDVKHIANAVLYMAGLPLDANVFTMTVMATQMPYVGRG